jgi:hypothetical protein
MESDHRHIFRQLLNAQIKWVKTHVRWRCAARAFFDFFEDVEAPLSTPGHAPATEHCQGSDGTKAGGSLVLDVAQWPRVLAVPRVRFARGRARYR